jgi:L-threonylcarbamoyladenylate synthase
VTDSRGPTIVAADAADAIERAVAALRSGMVVGIPTETVYGLAVLPEPAALANLVAAKQRSADKGIALLVDSLEQVRELAHLPAAAERLAARFWPGPLTLVLPVLAGRPVPELLTGGRPTVGVRLPDHAVPRALARLLGPLAASSANISGEPDAMTAGQLAASLGAAVALILDDGPVGGGVPSTVVACPHDGPPTVLREGALSAEAIAAASRLDAEP